MDLVATKMTPASSSDVDSQLVKKADFATHLGWISALWATTWSVLSFYKRTLGQRIEHSAIAQRILKYLAYIVLIWGISSANYRQHSFDRALANTCQILFTIFQEGLDVDGYWTSGPDGPYRVRIWYTTVSHVTIDLVVLLFPIPWIFVDTRSQDPKAFPSLALALPCWDYVSEVSSIPLATIR